MKNPFGEGSLQFGPCAYCRTHLSRHSDDDPFRDDNDSTECGRSPDGKHHIRNEENYESPQGS